MSLQLLREEAERKKRERAELFGGDGNGDGEREGRGRQKWIRRGDLEAAKRRKMEEEEREDKRLKEAALKKEEGEGKEGEKGEEELRIRKVEEAKKAEEAKRIEEEREKSALAKEVMLLSREEVVRRLRAQGEPATLFGETNLDRYKRLKEIGLRGGEDHTKGQRNIFQQKMRAMKESGSQDVYLEHEEVPQAPVKSKHTEMSLLATEEPKCDEDYVRMKINVLMAKWKESLDSKSAEERRTQKGRSALATYEQSQEYLAPLQKKLKKRQLGVNVLNALVKIFKFVEQKEYVRANDVYLRLAIGNSPWPMGATMVGIHARTAREKIGEGKIAHVMNDEPTRKFIQAVKRLITMAQSWSPTVPSKMISS